MKPLKTECAKCGNKDKSIFCELEDNSLSDVSNNKVMNGFKRGQVLFHEGNPAFGVYCISSGKVKLTKLSESGKETLINIAGPGDIVGFQHMMKSGINEMTATALEDSHVCFLDFQFFQKMVRAENSCSVELLTHIARDMSALQERMAGLQSRSVRERVEYLLKELAARFGAPDALGTRIGVQLSRDEMASMLGMATETLIRELSMLKEENVIRQDGKAIILVNKKFAQAQA